MTLQCIRRTAVYSHSSLVTVGHVVAYQRRRYEYRPIRITKVYLTQRCAYMKTTSEKSTANQRKKHPNGSDNYRLKYSVNSITDQILLHLKLFLSCKPICALNGENAHVEFQYSQAHRCYQSTLTADTRLPIDNLIL